MNKGIEFSTMVPITYVDKKLGVILTLNCYGKIVISKDIDILDNFLKHIQKVFNFLSEELSYEELLSSPLVKEVFIEYYNNLWRRRKISLIDFNLSSITPTMNSMKLISKAKKTFCPECGKKLKRTEKFCSECGYKI